jgi:TonB family protein
MKQCPACRRQYTDDLTFCLEDGSSLADIPFEDREIDTQFAKVPGTVASQGPIVVRPVDQRRSNTLTIAIAVGLFLVAGIVLVASVVGGYLYYASRPTNPIPPATPTPTRPTPSRSPEASPTPTPGRSSTPGSVKDTPDGDDLTTVDLSKDENGTKKPVPKQISGGVLNGKAVSLPKPVYPPAARAVRASGAVSVQVLVDEEGNVVSASAVSGHPLLRASAVQAARSAKFTPTKLAGQPVKVSGVVTYNFVP